jgi:hypothetical protein
MAADVLSRLPDIHTSFDLKYQIVREGRNAALHEGALARHLTVNAVELSLVLEETLMSNLYRVGDFMVRSPVCAYLWQPLSLIRQTMLVNSFSYLPVPTGEGEETTWKLVSDFRLAQYLRIEGKISTPRMTQKLQEAVNSGELELLPAKICSPDAEIESALRRTEGYPVLVPSPDNRQIMGILTAFDLL